VSLHFLVHSDGGLIYSVVKCHQRVAWTATKCKKSHRAPNLQCPDSLGRWILTDVSQKQLADTDECVQTETHNNLAPFGHVPAPVCKLTLSSRLRRRLTRSVRSRFPQRVALVVRQHDTFFSDTRDRATFARLAPTLKRQSNVHPTEIHNVYTGKYVPSVRRHCWLGDKRGHPACKKISPCNF